MKNNTLFCMILFVSAKVFSQDYLISFTGTGASSDIDSIRVENLIQNTVLIIPGGAQLRLKADYTGVDMAVADLESPMHIYPNPSKGNIIAAFEMIKSGLATFEIFDMSGYRLAKIQPYLSAGRHAYSIEGMRSGIFAIRINTQDYSYTGKILSQSDNAEDLQIRYDGLFKGVEHRNEYKLKSTDTETTMQYTTGDRLKYTGFSGKYRTVVMDVPTASKNLTFTFVFCKDKDNNYYPIVIIGAQTWMAENLKTTRYDYEGAIPHVTDAVAWAALTTPAYSWYNNDAPTNKAIYGALYNWHAVNTGRLCPSGWHVPLGMDWSSLESYLKNNGYGFNGSENDIGKSLAASSGWTIDQWQGTIGNDQAGNNSSGFTALPGGARFIDGTFYGLGNIGIWWSNDRKFYTDSAYFRSLYYNYGYVTGSYDNMKQGYSVRCIKNIDIPTNNLIAWYPLNGNAVDSSGNNNNGTVYGAVTAQDRFGNASGAMFFDGINDYIDLPDISEIGPELTISAWVNIKLVKTWARVIEYGGGEFVNNIIVTLSTTNTGKPGLLVCSGECNSVEIPTAISLNTWQHIAFTLTGNTGTCYLNGINVGTAPINRPHEAVLRTINYIGRSNFAADQYAHAAFDNIRIYSRALTDEEIIALTGE
jgi:uncharacterized protein (TIGR02145 family)